MESVQAYLKGVLPLLQGAGGKVVERLKVERARGFAEMNILLAHET
jgi:hypothetical protein